MKEKLLNLSIQEVVKYFNKLREKGYTLKEIEEIIIEKGE